MISIHPTPPDPSCPKAFWSGFHRAEKVGATVFRAVWSPCLWKGGRRKEANFEASHYGALDFDDGSLTLAEAIREWGSYTHLIATTKSHQVAKGDKAACDRFRVIFRWERPITDLKTYRWNMAELVKRYGADRACIDGARFYWPCVKMESVHGDDGRKFPVDPAPCGLDRKPTRNEYLTEIKYKRENYRDGFPPFIHKFLYHGQLFGAQASRNVCCYTTAIFLLELGYPHADVTSALLASPFSRDGFDEREIHSAVASASRSITSVLGVSSNESRRRGQKKRAI